MSNSPEGIKKRRLDALPTAGFGLQVDGKIKSQYETAEAALKAGLEIKTKFPVVQVAVFDAATQIRSPVELPSETSET